MWKQPGEASLGVKEEAPDFVISSIKYSRNGTLWQPIQLSSSSEEDDSHEIVETDDQSAESTCKQLVLYDPVANGAAEIEPVPPQRFQFQSPVYGEKQLVLYDPVANGDGEIGPVSAQPLDFQSPASRGRQIPQMPSGILPAVGAFTIQCNSCFKWRLIPTKEKYEEIREHILERPFYCESAREWRPDISCDDPTDLSQDGSRLWAIDKPNIAQPPCGWQRLLRIRGEGSTKFADIYYVAPSGKRLRSMVEIQKYLMEHPEYLSGGVTLSQFSFQTPKPLQEDYVRKRPARVISQCNSPKPLELDEASPRTLPWTGADDFTEPQPSIAALPLPPCPGSDFLMVKKKKKRTWRIESNMDRNPAYDQLQVEEPGQSGRSSCDP